MGRGQLYKEEGEEDDRAAFASPRKSRRTWSISRAETLLSGCTESLCQRGLCSANTSFIQSVFIEHLLRTQQALGM